MQPYAATLLSIIKGQDNIQSFINFMKYKLIIDGYLGISVMFNYELPWAVYQWIKLGIFDYMILVSY